MHKILFIPLILLLFFSCTEEVSQEELKAKQEYRKKEKQEREEREERTAAALKFLYKLEQSDSLLYEDVHYIISEEAIEAYKRGDLD